MKLCCPKCEATIEKYDPHAIIKFSMVESGNAPSGSPVPCPTCSKQSSWEEWYKSSTSKWGKTW